ncbi:MAG: mechanosensitive ion channel family protein [Cyanobacteria bacterium P01_G01_bin.38]
MEQRGEKQSGANFLSRCLPVRFSPVRFSPIRFSPIRFSLIKCSLSKFLSIRRQWQRRWLLGLMALIITLWVALPVSAQPSLSSLPTLSPVLMQVPGSSSASSGGEAAIGWVMMDGEQVFQVAAPKPALSHRKSSIEDNLTTIRDRYLDQPNTDIELSTIELDDSKQPSLYVNGQYLLTITDMDARMQGTTPAGVVENLSQTVPEALEQATQLRQPASQRRMMIWTGGAVAVAIAIILVLQIARTFLLEKIFNWFEIADSSDDHASGSSDSDETKRRRRQLLKDLLQVVLYLAQGLVLAATVIWSLGLFPQTRPLQGSLIAGLKIPLIVIVIVVVASVGIRLSYLLIDRFVAQLRDRDSFEQNRSRRLELRTKTIASVVKNIANFIWIAIGLVAALTLFGLNLGVLLASIGLIGLAISLATQNLIKGTVTGFFILLEDQYAIGDVVEIDGDGGLVENMNLRITQLRDTGGRLITIPMSDITRVANYSLHWSRCDLKIPVHYNANLDDMLQLTRQIGNELQSDSDWGELILEDPKVLGVEEFGDSAITIRVWIKTQPMKQWDVSREYRRRFKLALQDCDHAIPFPQREVWLRADKGLQLKLRGKLDSTHSNRNGSNNRVKQQTDPQPQNVPDSDINGDSGKGGDPNREGSE